MLGAYIGKIKYSTVKTILYLTFIFGVLTAHCNEPYSPVNGAVQKKNQYSPIFEKSNHSYLKFHEDSIHQLNFRYPDKKRGFRPYIVPTFLITTGTALHFMTEFKENVRDYSQENWQYSGSLDDYIQYAPLAATYALNAAGIKGKNNFGNRTAIFVKAVLLREIFVSTLKITTGVTRPSGGKHSFPSGHTSFAFAMAHFMSREYNHRSKWYSVAAYATATSVGVMRITRNAHWISDVVAGAGFGILSTELIYLTHQYKWDNEHLKNFDIFPFKSKKQNGLTLVYRF